MRSGSPRSGWLKKQAQAALEAAGSATVSISAKSAKKTVRVGPMHGMKVLEFRAVAVFGVADGAVPTPSGGTSAEEDLSADCEITSHPIESVKTSTALVLIELRGGIMAAAAENEPLRDETYLPPEDNAEIIDFLSALRDRGQEPADPRPRLVGPDGKSVEIPESMFDVLLQVAAAMKAGLAVTVAPHHLTLSTQEAADLLRISRTTLVRLLEAGAIPFEKPSRHRRVRLDDLLEYRRRQRSQAELAFADMVADAERLGLYDADPAEVKAALKAARKHSGR